MGDLDGIGAVLAGVRRQAVAAREDEMFAWVELREAGVIDPDAPWPFADLYPGGMVPSCGDDA